MNEAITVHKDGSLSCGCGWTNGGKKMPPHHCVPYLKAEIEQLQAENQGHQIFRGELISDNHFLDAEIERFQDWQKRAIALLNKSWDALHYREHWKNSRDELIQDAPAQQQEPAK